MSRDLIVGGLTPLTTIDYPGRLAAVVFCQGCPWRCRYCQNGHLVQERRSGPITWPQVMAFLERRQGLLDGVVFSGGEPTAQAALGAALRDVGRLGFRCALHTNGAYPGRLKHLLPDLDWVGLDIKALPADYAKVTGVAGSGKPAWESLALLQRSNVAFEVRVTVHDRLLPDARFEILRQQLRDTGIERPTIQICRTNDMLDPSLGINGKRAA